MTNEEAAEILKRSVEELNDAMAGVTMSEGPKAVIQRHIDAYSMAVDALLHQDSFCKNATTCSTRTAEKSTRLSL